MYLAQTTGIIINTLTVYIFKGEKIYISDKSPNSSVYYVNKDAFDGFGDDCLVSRMTKAESLALPVSSKRVFDLISKRFVSLQN